jgi:O-antigen ligase
MQALNDRWPHPRVILLRALFAALVLVAVYLLSQSMAGGRLDPVVPVAAIIALVGAGILYKLGRFEYGILAIAVTAGMVNFFTLPTGRESRVVISLAIALALLGIWGLQLILHRGNEPRLKPSMLNKPLLVFVLINIIAYAWGILMRDPLVQPWPSFANVQIAALIVNIGLPLLALMVANKFGDVKWIRALTWTIILIGAFRIISEKLGLPTLSLGWNGARGLFPTWVCALAFALALFDERLPKWQRVGLLAVVALWFHHTFVDGTVWLSGWIPIVVAVAVITFVRSRKLFAVLAVLALVVVALDFTSYYSRIVTANEEEGSTSRLDIWALNLKHVENHPFFGMGPAGYAPYNMHYHPQDARSTHNNYFDVLAQNGIIGMVSFVVLMATFVRICLRNARGTHRERSFEAAFAAATLGGCLAALVAMALGDWVLPFAYNQTITGFDNASYTWMMLGGAAALEIIRRARGAQVTPALPGTRD